MRVGILGTRGIPNAYGGFEQFAQYLALGLVRRGHEVSVYNSSDHPHQGSEWEGVRIIHCRDWEKKIGTAGQFLYDLNCFRDASRRNYDILLQLGYTSSSVWHRFWPKGAINVVNMDGLEWKRSKYNRLTRRFLKHAERWAAEFGDRLVADSIGIKEYLLEQYDKTAIFIPYGADIPDRFEEDIPEHMGLAAGSYMLVIARMEPENNIELILQGWMASDKERPLVLVGHTGNRFGRYLIERYRHDNLRFTGAIYDLQTLNALRHYSCLYFHGHSVGGTNPSLLEAMACSCAIAAHDNVFNRSVLGRDAFYFSSAMEVTSIIQNGPEGAGIAGFRERNLEKIALSYCWETIIDDYEKLFTSKKLNNSL